MKATNIFTTVATTFCLSLLAPQVFAAENATNGKKVFKTYCAHCHNSSAKESRVGAPSLNNVFSRHDEEWINQWIKSPDAMIKTDHKALELSESNRFGLTMPTLPAMQEEQNRRDVIAYLKTLK